MLALLHEAKSAVAGPFLPPCTKTLEAPATVHFYSVLLDCHGGVYCHKVVVLSVIIVHDAPQRPCKVELVRGALQKPC